MNVSFIVPEFLSGTSFLQQPLGLLYAARLMEKQGHHVKIEDVRMSHITLSELVRRSASSNLIFLTSTPYDQTQNYFVDYRYAYTVKTANYLKRHLPHVPLIVCGAHSTVRPELVLDDMKADIVVRGEYIYTMLEVVKAFSTGLAVREVPNLVYVRDNHYVHTPIDYSLWHPSMPDDLFPAYDKVEMSSYFGVQYVENVPLRRRNRAVIQASRGCPYSCSYCHNFWGSRVSKRSPESVLMELEILEQEYGVREIFFIDLTFTLDRDWVTDICELLIEKQLDLELTVETRVDLLDAEMLQQMANAGFKNIWLGVESFSNAVLEASNKGHTADIVAPVIEMIRGTGIDPHLFIMLGMPGETVGSLNETIATIHALRAPYTRSVMVCTPRYGTPHYRAAKNEYPEVARGFHRLNAVKGLVANEITPSLLLKAKEILRDREFVFRRDCPQL